MNRRRWLKTIGAGVVAAGMVRGVESAEPASPRIPPFSADAIGIIGGTVRREFAADMNGTLGAIAAMGYRYWEGGVPANMDPKAFAAALKSAGLQSIAVGAGSMSSLLKDTAGILRQAEALSAHYIACYWPWMSSAESLSRQEVLETAARLNEIGREVSKAGRRLLWHNHDKEFAKIDGEFVIDLLLRETDPNAVGVELDWYWVVKGGSDPVELFKRHPGRFDLAHVKDMNNHVDKGITCVGRGLIDFERIIRSAAAGGTRTLIVEHESALDGLRCAKTSIDHLKTLL